MAVGSLPGVLSRTDGRDDGRLLRQVLDVRPLAGREDVFAGANLPHWRPRLFGGQVLGQAAVAAGRTAPADRVLHSMHAYFLRPGDPDVPVELSVERLRDGRSFSARRVQALQDGAPILSGIASFQVPAEGLDHARPAPDVPGPEGLPSDAELLEALDHPAARLMARARPVELRHVDEAIYAAPAAERRDEQAVWVRLPAGLADDPLLHQAGIAFLSDVTVLEPVLRRHGLPWGTPGMRVASLDHALWWHRPARADEWLLHVSASPSASGARGMASGWIYDEQRRLVATVAQEGMVRLPQQP